MLSQFRNLNLNTKLIKTFLISCILTISSTILFHPTPLNADIAHALAPPQVSRISPTNQGNIVYAPIFLDGRQLFQIAAVEATNSNPDVASLSPLQARVRMYEEKLNNVLSTGFNTKTLVTTVDKRAGQTVILVGDGNKLERQQPLITVTEVDAQIHGLSVTDLANRFSNIIRRSLIQAQLERQPEYLRRKAIESGFIFLGIILSSGIILKIYQMLQNKVEILEKSHSENLDKLADLRLKSDSSTETSDKEEIEAQIMISTAKKLSCDRKLSFNRLWRLLLIIAVFLIWVVGFAWISGQFPFTRWLEDWLLTKPILLGIILGTILTIKITNIIIDYCFKKVINTQSQKPNSSPRTLSRLTTFSNVVKGIFCFAMAHGCPP